MGLVDGTFSIERDVLVNNVVAMAKAAKMYDLPVVLSTIGVSAGYQQDTLPEIKEWLPGVETVDRHTVDAWDAPEDDARRVAWRPRRYATPTRPAVVIHRS